jgi:DNA-binding transcriptional MocR family regulator
MHERAGRITADHEKIGLALLKRLGQDGRLDPSHATIAQDCGKAVSTVQRALKRLAECGLLGWLRRIARDGNRVVQTSNSYMLTLGNPPTFPESRCETPIARQTRKDRDSSAQQPIPEPSERERLGAQAALAAIAARRQAAVLDAMTMSKR